MASYIMAGIREARSCFLEGVIVFALYQLILIMLKKRNIRDYKTISKLLLVAELLLSIYICTILAITGVYDRILFFSFSPKNLLGFINVPFVGASMKMVTLNFLLFVPYGFLVFFVFTNMELNLHKAFFIGFLSSLGIEIIQAFTGRLTEIDDLLINTAGFIVGYIFASGVRDIWGKNKKLSGLKHIILVTLISAAGLFLISFVASGDEVQLYEDTYYSGITSSAGSLEELDSITEVNIYWNHYKKAVLDNQTDNYRNWYENMGMSIDNKSLSYKVEDVDATIETILADDKTYLEVKYIKPQQFRFYNNRDWTMKNVTYLLYCFDNGDLWYGEEHEKLSRHALYCNADHPFVKDEETINEIIEYIQQ